MTDSQFLVLLGTIYLTPHFHPIVGNCIGLSLLIFASLQGLGWV
jgi:hypothetical protein